VGVAFLRKNYPRFADLEPPTWDRLSIVYGVAIASHILLDGMTSFGTRMWFPISQQRVAWDILFIIDFTFTSFVLLPQIAAWIFKEREEATRRAVAMFLVFSVGAFVVWKLADAVGFPFHRWITGVALLILAVLFFAPLYRGAGFGITTAEWCRAGTGLTLVYLFFCTLAHHTAFARARAFAVSHNIPVERIAALPLPPSFLDWGGVIRSLDGVYQSRFDLRSNSTPQFWFRPDSPPDVFIARAFQLSEVQTYWTFARFPVIRSFAADGQHFVDFNENRFITRRTKGPAPFSYRVIFDNAGNPIEEGWQADGMDVRRMIKILPAHSGNSQ